MDRHGINNARAELSRQQALARYAGGLPREDLGDLFTRANIHQPISWAMRGLGGRRLVLKTLDDALGDVRRERSAAAAELEGLREGPPPLTGSREAEALAQRVRALEAKQGARSSLAISERELETLRAAFPPEQLVRKGSVRILRALIAQETHRLGAYIRPLILDAQTRARTVSEALDGFAALVQNAETVMGEHLAGIELSIEDLDALRRVGELRPPTIVQRTPAERKVA